MKLLNAFSLQMLEEFPISVSFKEIPACGELGMGACLSSPSMDSCSECTAKSRFWKIDFQFLKSCIGHADTAAVLGVSMNRVNVKLKKGEQFVVAQLQGGRLPEGSTTLPEGFSFKFFLGTIY